MLNGNNFHYYTCTNTHEGSWDGAPIKWQVKNARYTG